MIFWLLRYQRRWARRKKKKRKHKQQKNKVPGHWKFLQFNWLRCVAVANTTSQKRLYCLKACDYKRLQWKHLFLILELVRMWVDVRWTLFVDILLCFFYFDWKRSILQKVSFRFVSFFFFKSETKIVWNSTIKYLLSHWFSRWCHMNISPYSKHQEVCESH